MVSSLNNENTRLIGMKPVDAMKQTLVEQGFSQPVKEYEEKLLDIDTKVRYLYEPGELEAYQYKGERRKRSSDLRQGSSNNSVTNFVLGFSYIFQRET